jgi:hypothetical protein
MLVFIWWVKGARPDLSAEVDVAFATVFADSVSDTNATVAKSSGQSFGFQMKPIAIVDQHFVAIVGVKQSANWCKDHFCEFFAVWLRIQEEMEESVQGKYLENREIFIYDGSLIYLLVQDIQRDDASQVSEG